MFRVLDVLGFEGKSCACHSLECFSQGLWQVLGRDKFRV